MEIRDLVLDSISEDLKQVKKELEEIKKLLGNDKDKQQRDPKPVKEDKQTPNSDLFKTKLIGGKRHGETRFLEKLYPVLELPEYNVSWSMTWNGYPNFPKETYMLVTISVGPFYTPKAYYFYVERSLYNKNIERLQEFVMDSLCWGINDTPKFYN